MYTGIPEYLNTISNNIEIPKLEDPGRSVGIHIRCRAEERDRLRSLAKEAGLSMTDFILASTVYGAEIDRLSGALDTGLLERLYDELHAQGVNLNQIARAVNRLAQQGSKRLSDTRMVNAAASLAMDMHEPMQEVLDALAAALGARRSVVSRGRGAGRR